jgi:hypothetical protein
MAYYANADQRKSLVAGLRSLAEFLDAHPDVPAPRWVDVMVFPCDGTDEQRRAEVDEIAVLIDGIIDQTSSRGHYVASRHFGPVEYRAIAIPRENEREGQ